MGKWIHSWIGPDKNGYRPFWKGKFKCHMVYLDHRILLYNVYPVEILTQEVQTNNLYLLGPERVKITNRVERLLLIFFKIFCWGRGTGLH